MTSAVEIAGLPEPVRGHGQIKRANADKAAQRRRALWAEWKAKPRVEPVGAASKQA